MPSAAGPDAGPRSAEQLSGRRIRRARVAVRANLGRGPWRLPDRPPTIRVDRRAV